MRAPTRLPLAGLVLALALTLLAAPDAAAESWRARAICHPLAPQTPELLTLAARADRDRDGRANVRDRDVDGDGRPNGNDRDIDDDRAPNGRDGDVDGDRIPNIVDRDTDGDGRPNARDRDVDGDGRANARDADADGDGLPNAADPDRQSDCVPDAAAPDGPGAPDTAAEPAPRVPGDFVGMVAEDAFARTGRDRDAVLAAVAATGAGVLRQRFDWQVIERAPGVYDFSDYDSYVAATARHGLDVLPILFQPPGFRLADALRAVVVGGDYAPGRALHPPAANDEFAAFAARLVERYGPSGSFWAERPELPARPIRSWQIWNEPSLPVFWSGRPDPAAYGAMLRTVGAAIEAVDPGAEIVAAGLPDSGSGIPLERFLSRMYQAAGRDAFDTVALHPYAASVGGMVSIIERARAVMAKHGDAEAGIWVTEFGWAAGFSGAHPFKVDEAGQAALVRSALLTLAAHAERLRLRGMIHYDWRDLPAYDGVRDFWGLHTGLLWEDGRPKAAAAVFAETARALTGRAARARSR